MTGLRWLASNDAARIAWALAIGYLIGRARPWSRLGDWAELQVRFGERQWMATRLRQAVVATAYAITRPRAAWAAHRHSDEPEPVRFESQFLPPDREADQ